MNDMPKPCEVIRSLDYGPQGFQWLTLKRLTWTDPEGRIRFWESAERTTRAACGVDGVAVIARVVSSGAPPQVMIISQFRPPVGAMCLELPAGLIDEGEGAGEAALRELKEETGYHGRLLSLTPVCASDPGMSAANMVVALVEVASDAPENADVEQNLHDGEFISVEMAPWDDLMSWLLEKKHREGCQVDARLLAFAMGLHEGKIMEHADHAKEETDNEPTGVALPVVDSPETLPAHGCGKATSTEGNGAHEGEGAAAEGSAVQGLIDVVRSTSFVAGAVSGAVLASILLCALRR